jgi:putative membrane protein
MKFISTLLVNAIIVFLLAWLLAGVHVADYLTAIIVAVVLGLINMTIRPILTIITLPITILTLGLFLLVLNGLMVLLVDYLIPGFSVDGLIWGIVFTVFLGIANLFVNMNPFDRGE